MDKYEVIKHIGRGSFGEVYTAKRKADGKIVVLKSIARVKDRQYNGAKSEIAIMKELDHPNIVKLYDDFMDDDKVVLCMEYVPGGDLQKLIVAHKNASTHIEESKIWQYLTEIAMGLTYMHSKHMLHRDIKPENVLLTEEGTAKLTDFGAGKIIEAGKMTETTIGTDFYLSPEVIDFQPYNEETDIWSLGVTVYELAALKRPYIGDNKFTIRRLIRETKPKPLPDMYSQELAALIDLMLVADPTKRISAAGILRHPRVVKERRTIALRRLGYVVDPESPTKDEEERLLIDVVAAPLADGGDTFDVLRKIIPGAARLVKEAKMCGKSEKDEEIGDPVIKDMEEIALRAQVTAKEGEIQMLKEIVSEKDAEINLLKEELTQWKKIMSNNNKNCDSQEHNPNNNNEGEHQKMMSVEEEEEDNDNDNNSDNGCTEKQDKEQKGTETEVEEEEQHEYSEVDLHSLEVCIPKGNGVSTATTSASLTTDEMEEVSIPISGLKTKPIDPDDNLLEILTNSGSNNTIGKQGSESEGSTADENITGKKSWNHQKRAIIGNYFSTPKKKMTPPSPIGSPAGPEKAGLPAEYLGLVPPLRAGSSVAPLFFWKKHEIVKTKSTGHRAKTLWDNKNTYKLEKPCATLMVMLHSGQQQQQQQQLKIRALYVKQMTSSGLEKVSVNEKDVKQLTNGETTWMSCTVTCPYPVTEFRAILDDALNVEEVVVINGCTKGLDSSGGSGNRVPTISFAATAPSNMFSPSANKKK